MLETNYCYKSYKHFLQLEIETLKDSFKNFDGSIIAFDEHRKITLIQIQLLENILDRVTEEVVEAETNK